MRLINKKHIRLIARESLVYSSIRFPTRLQPDRKDEIRDLALARVKRDLKDKGEFGSGIVASILMSLAIKFATKLIIHWIENELFSNNDISEQFTTGEPE